jgi:hypothetical protein
MNASCSAQPEPGEITGIEEHQTIQLSSLNWSSAYAGGEDHYAADFANTDGYEVELIANQP